MTHHLELKPCPLCGEPFCLECWNHYEACSCPGPHGEPPKEEDDDDA